MFDGALRPLIDGPLNAIGARLARAGITADGLTIAGFGFGLLAAASVAGGAAMWALVPLLAGRLCDGLDGAVARHTAPTDRGGFLDIVLDFVFYGIFPLSFAVADPAANALAAAFLLFGFLANGTSFLAFAIIAQKQGLSTAAQGPKSIFYLAGIAEGAETIGFFVLMCLLPGWFAVLATVFGAMCLASAAARIIGAYRRLGPG